MKTYTIEVLKKQSTMCQAPATVGYVRSGTLAELIETFKADLELGQFDAGCCDCGVGKFKVVSQDPKTIQGLVAALNKARRNRTHWHRDFRDQYRLQA